MAEFPDGRVREVRRGGAGVLELLLLDLSREQADGYIRVERQGEVARVGQLVLSAGRLVMCLHEADELNMGRHALEELRADAASDDSRLSIHDEVDLEVVFDLHPEARLHLDDDVGASGDRIEGWEDTGSSLTWWQQRGQTEWIRPKTDAELESERGEKEDRGPTVPRTHTPGEEVEPGYCYLVDCTSPDDSLTLVRHLAAIGHPALVISRQPPARLVSEHGLDESDCRWLTEQTGRIKGVRDVSPASVGRELESFMAATQRAVLLLDGLEFLSGVHGFERMLGMLHSVLDTVQSSDHVLFIPADLEAWDPRQRGLLLRELDGLPAERVQLWSAHPADVEGHGFCQQEGIFRRPAEAPDLNAARVEFQDLSERLTAEAEAEAEAALAHEAESAEEEKLESIASEPEPADQFSMRNLIDEWKQEQVSDAPVVAEPEPEEIEQAPEVEHTDAGQLPEWATTPSLNMMVEEEGESAPVIESVADVKQDDEEVEPEQLSVLRQPTLDHRPRQPARGTRRRAPSARSLGVSAIATAAATSEEVPELAPAEPPDAGISQASLTAAGDRATHVGVLEGPADPDIFSVSGLDAAARGARGLEAALQEPHIPNSSEVHVGSWNAAAITAGDARDSEQRPDMDENPAARHVAARGQQTRSLTQFLAGKEIEALWYDRIKTVRMTGISGGILDRLRELSDRGHPVKELVNRIEADMDEGIALLSEYERRAEQATRLLANLGELESKGVIDPDSGVRMRTVIISLEDLDRLDKLFEDLQE
ncbi:MAG: hypothetical protein CXX71_00355 [Methanobacteriota archaeon]|nr:MAG: hypothetical protein CXX71_00355 [Euryarchaeota archaeon]